MCSSLIHRAPSMRQSAAASQARLSSLLIISVRPCNFSTSRFPRSFPRAHLVQQSHPKKHYASSQTVESRPAINSQSHSRTLPKSKHSAVLYFSITAVFASLTAGATYLYLQSSSPRSTLLNTTSFTPYSLVSAEVVSPTSTVFTLRPPALSSSSSATPSNPWTIGVWSVQIKQPQLQIARSYTPLPPLPKQSLSTTYNPNIENIRILIRRTAGEIPRYLHSLPVGAPVELRGPFEEYVVSPDNVEAIVFVAGGTGIAPALQIAHALRISRSNQESKPDGKANMQILWASRKREDCAGAVIDTTHSKPTGFRLGLLGGKRPKADLPTRQPEALQLSGPIVTQLQSLSDQEVDANLKVKTRYFVDEERSFIQRDDVQRAMQESLAATNNSSRTGRRILLVSGPDGFISYIAGPKLLQQGVEVQGPVGGLLSQVETAGWEVWKL